MMIANTGIGLSFINEDGFRCAYLMDSTEKVVLVGKIGHPLIDNNNEIRDEFHVLFAKAVKCFIESELNVNVEILEESESEKMSAQHH